MEKKDMSVLDDDSIRAIGQWIADRDSGVSSETMAAIAMGAVVSEISRFDAPHDPADFGRCYRLVKRVPAMRSKFDVIGALVPTFKSILENWDDLCALFERDSASGRSMDLYRRIKELRGDCAGHPVLKAA